MFQTYPKGGKHPSKSVGEQDSKDSWEAKRRTTYKNTTVKDTVYNGDVCKTISCSSGSGKAKGSSQVSAHYPAKAHAKFGSEK